MNGKVYICLDCIGCGGSVKVYCVFVENGYMFVLKCVFLENMDEIVFCGYCGEIDFLMKLNGVEWVINFFDYEFNFEKKVFYLVSVIFLFYLFYFGVDFL